MAELNVREYHPVISGLKHQGAVLESTSFYGYVLQKPKSGTD